MRGLQALVSSQTSPPAAWRCRAARKHRPDRALHQDHERRMHAQNPGSTAPNELPPGAQPLLRLVQRVSSAHGARGQDSQRSLLPIAPSESRTTHRTTQTLAAALALRRATHADRWTARGSIHTRSQLLRPGAIPPDRFAETRSVGYRWQACGIDCSFATHSSRAPNVRERSGSET